MVKFLWLVEYFINSYMFQKPHLGTIHDDEE